MQLIAIVKSIFNWLRFKMYRELDVKMCSFFLSFPNDESIEERSKFSTGFKLFEVKEFKRTVFPVVAPCSSETVRRFL
jgi:hypothetical protein